MLAYNRGLLHLGNFQYPVIVDTAGVKLMAAANESHPILRDHDQKRPVGHGEAVIEAGVLRVDGTLSQPTDEAKIVAEAHSNGFRWQASIGGRILRKPEFIQAGKKVSVNGREFDGPVYVVRAFLWKETSVVALGADEERADARLAASSEPPAEGSAMTFDEYLSAGGFDAAELSDKQKSALEAAYQSVSSREEKKPEKPVDDQVQELRAAYQAEVKRLREVQNVVRRYPDAANQVKNYETLEASAMNGDITPEAFELACLREIRASGPAIHSRGTQTEHADVAVIEAALASSVGIREDFLQKRLAEELGAEKAEKVLIASRSAKMRGYTFHNLCDDVLRAAGKYDAGRRGSTSWLEAAWGAENEIKASSAGFFGGSISGILSNLANKGMLQAYDDAGGIAMDIAASISTRDFKSFTRYRMTEHGVMEEVGNTGEIKSAAVEQETYTNQLKTYGRLFSYSRQDQINDDLGAFMQIPQMLGRMARYALEERVIAALTGASTGGAGNFFASAASGNDQLNYIVGAGTALSVANLNTLYTAALNQTDKGGKPVNTSTVWNLLVTTANWLTAAEIFNSTEVRDTTASTKAGTANVLRGMFRPIVSPHLHLAAFNGGSALTTQYFLIAQPRGEMGALSVAFLNGVRTPVIEQANLGGAQLGTQWRGYFDFGVATQDRRLAMRCKGAA